MRTPCDEVLLLFVPSADAARPWILAATILGSSMAFIDSTVVNVVLPTLQTTFHASVVDVQWVVESDGIFLSALILAGGALGDQVGRRQILLIGVGVFAAASIVCGLSSSIQQLITARSAQGVGAALLVPGSLAIISGGFNEESSFSPCDLNEQYRLTDSPHLCSRRNGASYFCWDDKFFGVRLSGSW